MSEISPEQLKRLYKSMTESCEQAAKENGELKRKLLSMEQIVKTLVSQMEDKDAVIQDTLSKRNEAMNAVLEENEKLREQIRSLKRVDD